MAWDWVVVLALAVIFSSGVSTAPHQNREIIVCLGSSCLVNTRSEEIGQEMAGVKASLKAGLDANVGTELVVDKDSQVETGELGW